MEKLEIKYRLTGKAVAPRAIRVETPGWGGADLKMENGSDPQPWHCLPFVEASTYGLELTFPYEKECRVVNDNGDIHFDWDYANEPGAKLLGGEFVTFFPYPATFYLFNTGLDLQCPPRYVIRTEPHPRFYTDTTGTVPLAIGGHVQTEWWPKLLFVVFRVPPPGGEHVFRKDEPFAQLLLIPKRTSYELVEMTAGEQSKRAEREMAIIGSRSYMATNIWHNDSGHEFNNHYKLLARAFARNGQEGVDALIKKGLERKGRSTLEGKTIAEALELGAQYQKAGKPVDARRVYMQVLERDPASAEATSRLGAVAASMKLPDLALQLARQAITLAPQSAAYQSGLAQILFDLGRYEESEAALRLALRLRDDDPQVMSQLALALAKQGRVAEALQICRAAVALDSKSAELFYRMGQILSEHGQPDGARVYYETAIALAPAFEQARKALEGLAEPGAAIAAP